MNGCCNVHRFNHDNTNTRESPQHPITPSLLIYLHTLVDHSGYQAGYSVHGQEALLWRGLAWRGVAWRSLTWLGLGWRSMAWHGVAWLGQTGITKLCCNHRLVSSIPACTSSSFWKQYFEAHTIYLLNHEARACLTPSCGFPFPPAPITVACVLPFLPGKPNAQWGSVRLSDTFRSLLSALQISVFVTIFKDNFFLYNLYAKIIFPKLLIDSVWWRFFFCIYV